MRMCKTGIAGPYGSSMFNIVENYQTVFHRGSTIVYPPITTYEGSSFSTFLPALVISPFFFKKKKVF